MLISTSELNSILQNNDVLIIDARSFKEYSNGHIPGSINLDLFSFHWIDTTSEGMQSFNKQAETIFSFVGVTNHKKVVFYDEVSGMLAARGVWMLLYFSHENAFLLDGGIKKWQKENLPLESKQNSSIPSTFTGKPNSEIIVGFEQIKNNLNSIKIIDARSADEFSGSLIRAARGGHIPNSENVDWNLNVNEDGTFKSISELSKFYNIPKDSEIVTYCQGAYRAANSFLALKLLGFKKVRVYLGSWGEWGNKLELPVEK